MDKRKRASAFFAFAVLLLAPSLAWAQSYLACQTGGVVTVCPGDARLKTTYKIGSAYLDLSGLASVYVALTGDQTIGGTKTFSAAPVMSGASIALNTIPAGSVAPGTVDNTEFGYLDGVTGPLQGQITSIANDVALISGSAQTLYLQETASDIVGYETLRTQPSAAAEDWDQVSVSSATSPLLIDSYATESGNPGVTSWPAGNWIFHVHGTVDSNTGVTQILARVYSRTVGGTETLLFSATSDEMDTANNEYQFNAYETAFAVGQTDRLVIKFYATTTSAAARTVRIYYQGQTQASYVGTPIPSPVAVSGVANQVLATPNGSTGTVVLRKIVGADITDASVSADKITGGTIGRLLYDNGTGGAWTGAGTSGYLLQSAAPGFAPVWSNTLTGVTIPGDLNTITGLTQSTLAPTFLLAAANGGTGQSTYTAGQTLYASAATTLSKLNIGAANTVYTSTGSAPSWAALPTASSGSSVLGAAFPLTSTDTYQDTGLSVSPPSAGEYQLTAQVKATLLATTGAPYATCRLYNVTAGAVLTNSELWVAFSPSAAMYAINTATSQKTYTLAAASTIRLECARRQATVWSVSEISSDVDGRTVLSYVKLAS